VNFERLSTSLVKPAFHAAGSSPAAFLVFTESIQRG
jgi:hypothetical protein